MRVSGAIDRWLARCWLAYPQLARRLLDACALYLRHAPCATGQRSLLTFCTRSLLPALPLFADAVVSLSARPDVRMRCFQLGGAHQADILSEWLLLTGVWQPALTAYMLRSLLPGDTLVDVGANTGYFALLGAALVGSTGRVVAVEACPRTHERLLANLALNPAHRPVVTAVHAAAAAAEGELTLYQHRREPLYNTTVPGAGAGGVAAQADVWALLQGSGALGGLGGLGGLGAVGVGASAAGEVSRLAGAGVWQTTTVRSAPLDALLGEAGVSEAEVRRARVLKVDVEGGEWAVLQGAAGLLRDAPATLEVVVELTPKWLELQGTTVRELLRHMRGLGFEPYLLAHEDYEISRALPPPPPPPPPRRLRSEELPAGWEQADIVFSRRDCEELN